MRDRSSGGALFLEPKCFWWANGVGDNGSRGSGGCNNGGGDDSHKNGSGDVIDGTTGLSVLTDTSWTDISRTMLLEKFRTVWYAYNQQRSIPLCTSAELGALLSSPPRATKELCTQLSFTTYSQAKSKLFHNFFKMS